jgi:sugar (pentulose or hexulose) kinase
MSSNYVGIDLGTQGVRILVVDAAGRPLADAKRSWAIPNPECAEHEQDSGFWWTSLLEAGDETFAALAANDRSQIRGIAVASTSGSLLVCNGEGQALRPAILHSDRRAWDESADCNRASATWRESSGFQFRATFSLPKLLWVKNNEPTVWQQIQHALHPADWLTGKLCGCWGRSDETNVLKLGYDLVSRRWPDFIGKLGVPGQVLPQVQPSGRLVGALLPDLARRWDLGEHVVIASGITDSNAVHLSSGSVAEGEWTTTIGTAMGIKGIVSRPVSDASGSFYCHRNPDGLWILGGASNVGGAALNRGFGLENLRKLETSLPTPRRTEYMVYPLEGTGDWFPLSWPMARRLEFGERPGIAERLLATYEGMAFIERWAYDRLVAMGVAVDAVTAAGGTNSSAAFLAMRATLLPKPLRTVENCCAAKGAAMLAAMAAEQKPLATIAARMANTSTRIAPVSADHDYLEGKYRRFVDALTHEFGVTSLPGETTDNLNHLNAGVTHAT